MTLIVSFRISLRVMPGEKYGPGLDYQDTRSLITLAMMVALNRAEEFRTHVRAAFNNGVSREQIKELLLQAAIYCGVPAANAAFHAAEEVLSEMNRTATHHKEA
jgi:4-carboxymuconolactone decarboxylase